MVTQILTANRTKGRTEKVRHIVIHTMEAPEKPDTAENIARMFATSSRQASSHYCIDADSVVQCVALADTAWACPGFNASGVQFEHAGYAAQNAAQWQDHYSQAMLRRSAQLAAVVAKTYAIPVRHLSIAEVKAGNVAGFMGHVDATKAGVGGNTHTDPGTAFPWDQYLGMVRAAAGGTSAPSGGSQSAPAAGPGWTAGPKVVTAWQHREGTTADGVISGQWTGRKANMPPAQWPTVQWQDHATGSTLIRAFQRRRRLTADGIAGPDTIGSLQTELGVTADGIAGDHTIEALAKHLGVA